MELETEEVLKGQNKEFVFRFLCVKISTDSTESTVCIPDSAQHDSALSRQRLAFWLGAVLEISWHCTVPEGEFGKIVWAVNWEK